MYLRETLQLLRYPIGQLESKKYPERQTAKIMITRVKPAFQHSRLSSFRAFSNPRKHHPKGSFNWTRLAIIIICVQITSTVGRIIMKSYNILQSEQHSRWNLQIRYYYLIQTLTRERFVHRNDIIIQIERRYNFLSQTDRKNYTQIWWKKSTTLEKFVVNYSMKLGTVKISNK